MPLGSFIRALGITALLATTAQAQESHPFRNSWFWGAKVGTFSIATTETSRKWAPSIGAEWLITRNAGGLLVFGDHTNFDARTSVDDGSTSTGRREVDISDLRRLGFAAVISPRAFGMARPYVGLGFSLNVVGRADALPDSAGNPASASVSTAIEDQRSSASVLGLAGTQFQFSRAALFTQVTATPGNERFLLNDGPLIGLEFGVRYNFGASVGR